MGKLQKRGRRGGPVPLTLLHIVSFVLKQLYMVTQEVLGDETSMLL